ncbi:hypothetical protein HS041_34565, partial [Planomonospora sp. ID67723]|uniref:hypothetical protein n=1 Tax=Planomonospora sp. ID67723 TaxID=2738134 RepID=UPI0018C36824
MAGDQIGEVEREGTQFLANLLVELLGGDVRSERRQLLTLPGGSRLVVSGLLLLTAVTRAGTAFTAVPAGTVVTVERTTLTTGTVLTSAVSTTRTVIASLVPATRTVIAVERTTLTTATRPVLTTRLVTI